MTYVFKSAQLCEVHHAGKILKGTPSEGLQYLVLNGVSPADVITALDEMRKNEHNYAEFGDIRRTFMYTGYSQESDMTFRGNA